MLPGCGRRGRRRRSAPAGAARQAACSRALADPRRPSMPVRRAQRLAVEPLHHQHPLRTQLAVHGRQPYRRSPRAWRGAAMAASCGPRRESPAPRSTAAANPFASRQRRSSGPAERVCSVRAIRPTMSRSRSTTKADPGRCTLTTTGTPRPAGPGRPARSTPPRSLGVELGEHRGRRRAKLVEEQALNVGPRRGRHPICRCESSSTEFRRQQVDRVVRAARA